MRRWLRQSQQICSMSINELNQLNQAFYRITAEAFDATRGNAWPGWEKLLPYLPIPLRVLDVGCGNGRFARFLAESLTGEMSYHGVDSNPTLLDKARAALQDMPQISVKLEQRDMIQQPIEDGAYNLIAIFGVLHHIPGKDYRQKFVNNLAQYVTPGGILVFSCWRFYEYPRFRDRIAPWPDNLQREQHDYLLDWRQGKNALRYCHYINDAEHQELVDATGLTQVLTYRADGKSGDMNRYSVLRRFADS
ncbi:MAG: class I SAM-dependent methyltransferase [Chloroflexi bacterium]|nr:MAG: class I SAM-dependent methyltransferase [Chloroflexota bacterium]